MKLISTKLTNLVSLEQSYHKPMLMYGGGLLKLTVGGKTTTLHSHKFVMGLLQLHKACKLGGDELHRPPIVALRYFSLPGLYHIDTLSGNSR